MSEQEHEQPQDQEDEGTEASSGGEGRRVEPKPAEDLESDPAYNPDEEHLKDLKGG